MGKETPQLALDEGVFRKFAAIAAIVVVGVAGLVLGGWWFGISQITSVMPSLATMKANTALGFAIAGLSLWRLRDGATQRGWRRPLGLAFAAGAAILGGLSALEYILHVDLSIDNLFFQHPAVAGSDLPVGRMSLVTAIAMLFSGMALWVLGRPVPNRPHFVTLLIAPVLAIGFVACIGHLFGSAELYKVRLFSSIAVHTGLCFILLALGVLCARPTAMPVALLRANNVGGYLVRRWLPGTFVLVPLLFWLRFKGEQAGWYGTEFGIVLSTLTTVTMLGAGTWLSALRLNRVDGERQQAQLDQRVSDWRFVATFEQAAVGMALVAPDGRWLSVNHKLVDIVGYGREELLDKTVQNITHPQDLDADQDNMRRMLAREIDTYAMDKRYLRKDGRLVWIKLTVSLVRTDRGEPDYFVSVVEDIDARKQTEIELERYRAHLQEMVAARTTELDDLYNNAPCGYHSLDADGRILKINNTGLAKLGYAREDLIGHHVTDFMTPESKSYFQQQFLLFNEEGRVRDQEFDFRRKDGSVVHCLVSGDLGVAQK